jgi:hypothetical protein
VEGRDIAIEYTQVLISVYAADGGCAVHAVNLSVVNIERIPSKLCLILFVLILFKGYAKRYAINARRSKIMALKLDIFHFGKRREFYSYISYINVLHTPSHSSSFV